MMDTVFIDATKTDAERRQALHAGPLFVFSPRPSTVKLCEDTRRQPKPTSAVELEPQIRLVCPPGGIILFSTAHLHSTVPNTSGRTRYSIDFRTVNFTDVRERRGAVNIDSRPTGTSLRDFRRGTDLAPFDEDVVQENVVREYESERPKGGILIYKTYIAFARLKQSSFQGVRRDGGA